MTAKKTTAILLSCSKFGELAVPSLCMENCEKLPYGLPRNDLFFKDSSLLKEKVKEKLGLYCKDKIILYVPTFRNTNQDVLQKKEAFDGQLNIETLLEALEKRWNGTWTFLYRLHPMADGTLFKKDKHALDVSQYSDVQELLCAADVMITDYSSIMWDFALTNKPCFIFAPDLDIYYHSRGFYIPINQWPFSVAQNNDELVERIQLFSEEEYCRKIHNHFLCMGSYEEGNASKLIVQWIIGKCN